MILLPQHFAYMIVTIALWFDAQSIQLSIDQYIVCERTNSRVYADASKHYNAFGKLMWFLYANLINQHSIAMIALSKRKLYLND